MPISYIDGKCHIKKLKSSRTCLIDYSGFILREWFLIAQGQTHTHTDFPDKSNFKKPGERWQYKNIKRQVCEQPTNIWLFLHILLILDSTLLLLY